MADSYASSLDERPAGWLPRPIERPTLRALEPPAALRAKLAALVTESTSERLPAGHWVVICPDDLLGHLAEATSCADQCSWSIEHRLTELDAAVEITSAQGLAVTSKLPPWLVARG
jgi:hypothetical protein